MYKPREKKNAQLPTLGPIYMPPSISAFQSNRPWGHYIIGCRHLRPRWCHRFQALAELSHKGALPHPNELLPKHPLSRCFLTTPDTQQLRCSMPVHLACSSMKSMPLCATKDCNPLAGGHQALAMHHLNWGVVAVLQPAPIFWLVTARDVSMKVATTCYHRALSTVFG